MLTLPLSRWRQAHSLLWQRYADVSVAAWLFAGCLLGMVPYTDPYREPRRPRRHGSTRRR